MKRLLWLLSMAGCATAYQPLSFTGGYTDRPLATGQYEVAFYGNGYTHREDVLAHFDRRASELCNGEPYYGTPKLTDDRRWGGRMWVHRFSAKGEITCSSPPL
jgi:hypothetical protein